MVTNRSAPQPNARDRSRHLDGAVAVSLVLRKAYLGELARWESANVRGRIRRANLRMASPIHSIPAAYRRRIERTLTLAVYFPPVGPLRLRVPNVFWSHPIASLLRRNRAEHASEAVLGESDASCAHARRRIHCE